MQEKNPIFREILLLNLATISFVKEFWTTNKKPLCFERL